MAETTRILWTRRECAQALGISERSLYSITEETDIPRIRLGQRLVRYPADKVREWVLTRQEQQAK